MMKTYAWLRMRATTGEFAIPTSEVSYNAHLLQVTDVLPCHGGKLQADGLWLQETWKFNHEWGQSLPAIASGAGHFYMPMVNCDRDAIQVVLDDPSLQEIAANDLIRLATTDRFDAPWQGVMLDLEGIPSSYKSALSDFLLLLSYHIRKAGLKCGVSVRGKTSDPGPDYDDAYCYDFSVVAQVADVVDLRTYGYYKPMTVLMDRSMSPYWWVCECIEYAINQGVPSSRLVLGIGLYSMYYPDSGSSVGRSDLSYDQAVMLIQDAGVKAGWVESGEYGLVRERLADLGPGHIWLHDADVLRHSLRLANNYSLNGIALFTLGMEDPCCWDTIGE